jgi:hypothetical protein
MPRYATKKNLLRLLIGIGWTVLLVLCFIRLQKLGDYPGFLAFGRAAVDDVMVYDMPTQRVYRPDFDGPWATWPPGLVPIASVLAVLDRVSPPVTVVLFRLANLWGFAISLLVMAEWLTGKRLRHSDPGKRLQWDAPILAFGLLLPIRMVMNNFEHTNVNPLSMGLVLLGLRMVARRPAFGGLVFGLGSAIKATPVLLLAWLVWRRRWRDLLFCTLGVVVGWIVLPMLIVGPDSIVDWWRGWVQALPESGSQDHWMNQSLRSVGITLWGDSVGVKLWYAGSVALFAFVVAAMRRPFRDVSAPRAAAEVAMLLVAITIVSPVSWKAHYVTLGPLAVAMYAMGDAAGGRVRVAMVRWLVVFALLLNATSREILGRPVAMWLQEHGSVLVVAVAMVLVAGWRLRVDAADATATPTPSPLP